MMASRYIYVRSWRNVHIDQNCNPFDMSARTRRWRSHPVSSTLRLYYSTICLSRYLLLTRLNDLSVEFSLESCIPHLVRYSQGSRTL